MKLNLTQEEAEGLKLVLQALCGSHPEKRLALLLDDYPHLLTLMVDIRNGLVWSG